MQLSCGGGEGWASEEIGASLRLPGTSVHVCIQELCVLLNS